MLITITTVIKSPNKTYEVTDTVDIDEYPDHPVVLGTAKARLSESIEQISYYIRKDEEKLQWENSSNTSV